MRTGRAALLAAGALTAASGMAQAQAPAGFYVAAGIGANLPANATVQPRGPIQPGLSGGNGEARFSVLPMGTLALGYGFGNGIRVELEGSVRASSVEGSRGFAALQPVTQAQGQFWNIGAMANAYVDLNTGAGSWIQPYLGIGLGYVHSELRDFRIAGNGQRLAVDASDGNFAYQAIAGASFPIAALPGLSATAEYRFMGTIGPEYGARLINLATGAPTAGRVEMNPTNHAIMVGLRYQPGVRPEPPPMPTLAMPPMLAPPPVAAAPAPAATRTFIVYFDIRSASLTARARELVAEAAQAARSGRAARIEVTGHADRSGTPAVNMRLSLRRAQAVAQELQRRGVARGDITIRGAGEAEPAVPTADGAREPQNRRVEIVVR
ncbi:OmpA family protein [Falsiroseomonas sp. CW058]|uniref:OmpA family protein n=1 Tax=Falsiroseomonas sp. CW058 TaxID=3388664 RepID=UPI003D316541